MQDAFSHWNDLSDPLVGATESTALMRGAAAIVLGIVVFAVFVAL